MATTTHDAFPQAASGAARRAGTGATRLVAPALAVMLASGAAASAAAFSAGPGRMALAVAALFFAFKASTLRDSNSLTLSRSTLYLLLWPGMNPRPFEGERRPTAKVDPCLALGAGKMAAGAALILIALRPGPDPLARAWLVMTGAVLFVHLGLFDVLTGGWRWSGFPVERICPEPWRAASVAEFWGRRWNLAFHAFARDCVYRPVARRFGRETGIAAVFLLSGLAHELAISFPAGGGWGLPTLYFAIHGALVGMEKRGVLRGRRWTTALFVLAPLPGLFHPEFIANVVFSWIL